MVVRTGVAVGLISLLGAFPCRAQMDCPNGMVLDERLLFSGTIGKDNPVRLVLFKYDEDHTAAALYYYEKRFHPIRLDGTVNDNAFVLEDTNESLEGKLAANGSFSGTWRSRDGKRRLPVSLKPVRRLPCNTGGSWKTFSHPKWPVTFQYPPTYRVDDRGDSLEVRCADPSAMLYEDSGIILRRIPVPNKRARRRGRSTKGQGMEIIDTGVEENRVYCTGNGYAGMGDGIEAKAFGTGERSWIEISSWSDTGLLHRVHKSVRLRESMPP